MTKKCKNCGTDLPESASFCPHCTQSQIDRTEVKPPRLWRKKTLYVLLSLLLLTGIVLAVLFLPHRPKTFEGAASLTYTDKNGTYNLCLSTFPDDIQNGRPEEQRSLTLSADGETCLPSLMGIYQNGALVDPDAFLSKVENFTVTASPDEAHTITFGGIGHMDVFAPSTLSAEVILTGQSGTNDIIWTLFMKNGDTIRLKHTYEIIPLSHLSYTADDVPLNTMEDLRALLKRIDEEVPAETVVDIYLPPETYTGDLGITTRAVNLYGCSDGSGRTVIEGSLTVSTHFPDNVMLHDLDFVGSGGAGLTASASAVINHCSFTGYDIGADVEDGGMIGVEACTFRQNGIGFRYNTNSYYSFKTVFPDSVVEDNGIGVQFLNIPGNTLLDFVGTVFSNNTTDIDNPISYPIETSLATFK